MLNLLLAICCSAGVILLFKTLEKIRVKTFHVIVFNYYTASLIGFLCYNGEINFTQIPGEPWFPFSFLLGSLFISLFYVIALTTQKNGITVAAVANNMSLIMPVIVAILFYKESANITKLAGIAFSLGGVVLTSIKKDNTRINKGNQYLPFVLFVGSGLIWMLLNHIEKTYLNEQDGIRFVPTIFCVAGILGTIVIIPRIFTKKAIIQPREIIVGIILGAINYGSIYFLVLALHAGILESSEIFPINNLGALAVATLFAFFVFKEKIHPKNWLGLVISSIAILMIAFNENI